MLLMMPPPPLSVMLLTVTAGKECALSVCLTAAAAVRRCGDSDAAELVQLLGSPGSRAFCP